MKNKLPGIQGFIFILVTVFRVIMALRPQQLPLDRDFVVDRCFVLFRACARLSPVGFPAGCWLFAARSPGGCASWPLAFALDALSTVHETAAESLYMKWPLNHRRCVEYS